MEWYIFVTVSQSLSALSADWKEKEVQRRADRQRLILCGFSSSCSLSFPVRQPACHFLITVSFLSSITIIHCNARCPHIQTWTLQPSLFIYFILSFQRLREANKLIPAAAVSHPQRSTASYITHDNIRGSISSVKPNFGCWRRDKVAYAVRRAQTPVVEALVCGATAADCTAVWLGYVLPPAGHSMQLSCWLTVDNSSDNSI